MAERKKNVSPIRHAVEQPTHWNRRIGFIAIVFSFIAYYTSRGTVGSDGPYAVCSMEGRKIYTVDDAKTNAECILVHGAKIADSGTLDDIHKRSSVTIGTSAFSVHYIPKGSIIVPGLSDSHCHILEYGASRQIPLSAGRTPQQTVSYIKDYILSHSDIESNKSRVIEGWGWDHASWTPAQFPTWKDLEADPVVAGRPVVLQSRDGHALWVSKAILDVIEPLPEAVPGGIILRDDKGGASGVFIDTAQELIPRPPLSEHELLRRFKTTVNDVLAVGLTSLHDAGLKPDSLAFFKRQAEQRILPIRIYGMTYFDKDGEYWGDKMEPFVGTAGHRLTARSVKIFADGALRTAGAALHAPYSDNPNTSGVMTISPETLKKVIPRFLKDGWQVNVHAIGDRANGIVLDTFEYALEGTNVSALRPRIEHAEIMTRADMVRLGKLGVIASVQPTHAISDMWYAVDRLGPERVKGLYAFRSIINSGARITLGSDFPVEDINPLKGFYAAITRLDIDGTSPHGPGGWFPDQRLTRVEALRGMTMDPAYASFTEDILGSLTVGKRADFVILSQDIMEVEPNKIMDTKVIATVIDGKTVYGVV